MTNAAPAKPKPKKSVALSGVPAGNTALCTVGRTGNDLHYRGYDILDFAEDAEFEEIAYLLVTRGEAGIDSMSPEESVAARSGEQEASCRIVGVDRLDYSKGLVARFRAFEKLLASDARTRNSVTLMQIAPPSRADVRDYEEIRRELETTAGHVNGRFADFDWVPIRYLNKSFDRDDLTCFYRMSRVGLVTPLRDGMNLVAKEYVASQSEKDPGVLVLSRFAGAAHELTEALIVNPYDEDSVADALSRALTMQLDERRARWRSMMDRLSKHDVHSWRAEYLAALDQPVPKA